MNYLRLSLAVSTLMLTLALPAFAGFMDTPVAAPSPSATGWMDTTVVAVSLIMQDALSLF